MNTLIRQRLGFAVSTAVGLTTLVSIPLYAQDDQAFDEDELILEEVLVTGTRLTIEDGFGRTRPGTAQINGAVH